MAVIYSNVIQGMIVANRLAEDLDYLNIDQQEEVIRHLFKQILNDNNGHIIKYARDHANKLMAEEE